MYPACVRLAVTLSIHKRFISQARTWPCLDDQKKKKKTRPANQILMLRILPNSGRRRHKGNVAPIRAEVRFLLYYQGLYWLHLPLILVSSPGKERPAQEWCTFQNQNRKARVLLVVPCYCAVLWGLNTRKERRRRRTFLHRTGRNFSMIAPSFHTKFRIPRKQRPTACV
ncbi:hypothetical protein BJX65DRAFT_107065 [Aspergillus insuetus]